ARVTAWPSPFRDRVRIDWVTASAAPVRVEIFDVAGRRIRGLTGRAGVEWDGRDGQGLAVAPGTYFVRVETDEDAGPSPVVRVVRRP
ncbi:MAG TPA: FlgD immunoglobulin-like domain containing protein, partial [bacterium]|nr:FlgD immunoglobulin-like domain containing protein [bacterium]